MTCQRIGRPPISTSGLGIPGVCSCSRVPRPPHRMTTRSGWSCDTRPVCPTLPYSALVRRFTRGQRGQTATVVEDRPRPLRGIRFDLAEQGGRLRQLSPLVRGFRAPEGFHLWNGEYESVDAEVLWAMVGGLRPHRAMVVSPPPMAAKILDAALPEAGRADDRPAEPRGPRRPHRRRADARARARDPPPALDGRRGPRAPDPPAVAGRRGAGPDPGLPQRPPPLRGAPRAPRADAASTRRSSARPCRAGAEARSRRRSGSGVPDAALRRHPRPSAAAPRCPARSRGWSEQEDAPPFEVLLVADATAPEGTAPLRADRPGASAARNVGLRAAQAPVVLFLGDDILASPLLLATHAEWHAQRPEEHLAVLGHVGWAKELRRTAFMAWLDRGIQTDYGSIAGDRAGWGHFYTTNLSLKTSFAEPFDEDIPFLYEDLDLGRRLHDRGLDLRYDRGGLGRAPPPADARGVGGADGADRPRGAGLRREAPRREAVLPRSSGARGEPQGAAAGASGATPTPTTRSACGRRFSAAGSPRGRSSRSPSRARPRRPRSPAPASSRRSSRRSRRGGRGRR